MSFSLCRDLWASFCLSGEGALCKGLPRLDGRRPGLLPRGPLHGRPVVCGFHK